jgi:hypothetical protein
MYICAVNSVNKRDVLFLFSKCFSVLKPPTIIVKLKDDHTPLVLDFMKDLPFLWNTKSAHFLKQRTRENSLQEVVQDLNFQEPTKEDLKLKIKTIRIRYGAELR